jgi:hypothetical protein
MRKITNPDENPEPCRSTAKFYKSRAAGDCPRLVEQTRRAPTNLCWDIAGVPSLAP